MPSPEPSIPAISVREGGLPGVRVLTSQVFRDHRGEFVKAWHAPHADACGINVTWTECYWSSSLPGVIRGMHYQAPPVAHEKLVSCMSGMVLDVALDLRPGAGRGRSWCIHLKPGMALFLPAGIAHGFRVLGEVEALLLYHVTTVHHPACDLGVRWDSFGFDWGGQEPVVSDRDRSLPAFDELQVISG